MWIPLRLHLPQQRRHLLRLGHEDRRAQVVGHRRLGLVVALGPHEVLGVHDADDVVDAVAGDGQAAEAVEDHDLHHVADLEVGRDRHHVGPRHHHLAHDGVAELDGVLDELALLGASTASSTATPASAMRSSSVTVGPSARPLAGNDHVGRADEQPGGPPQRRDGGDRPRQRSNAQRGLIGGQQGVRLRHGLGQHEDHDELDDERGHDAAGAPAVRGDDGHDRGRGRDDT